MDTLIKEVMYFSKDLINTLMIFLDEKWDEVKEWLTESLTITPEDLQSIMEQFQTLGPELMNNSFKMNGG